ncbi:hypothetical protein SARC_03567 [Sphaeroforma arctica JP610]|uniref:Uncharacterized protein n=1 Tax=Sphaeroforma arctica JP610 TaxID=667725 RepID=A0A0L0G5U4_9EUKA|nr:hypothetical protein SARC_03567 [Sphaeroforma arctica JP610]KNC84206.1 hypothetical protein SARC_03567 [Sphaeroforma arctica JP610]|eukprot:XP_014158108.1 hypothetical protein SARC_03567 [Sphaeroforma arctica JP610]
MAYLKTFKKYYHTYCQVALRKKVSGDHGSEHASSNTCPHGLSNLLVLPKKCQTDFDGQPNLDESMALSVDRASEDSILNDDISTSQNSSPKTGGYTAENTFISNDTEGIPLASLDVLRVSEAIPAAMPTLEPRTALVSSEPATTSPRRTPLKPPSPIKTGHHAYRAHRLYMRKLCIANLMGQAVADDTHSDTVQHVPTFISVNSPQARRTPQCGDKVSALQCTPRSCGSRQHETRVAVRLQVRFAENPIVHKTFHSSVYDRKFVLDCDCLSVLKIYHELLVFKLTEMIVHADSLINTNKHLAKLSADDRRKVIKILEYLMYTAGSK